MPPLPKVLTLAPPAPPLIGVRGVRLAGLVVDLGAALAPGAMVAAEVRLPRLPKPLQVRLRARQAQAIAPGTWRTVLEPAGVWDELIATRRALADALGSRVLDGERPLGWLVLEPEGTWACYGTETGKSALLVRSGAQIVVRRRRDPGRYVATTTLADALVLAFDEPGAHPRCEPPSSLGAGLAEPPPPPPPPPPASVPPVVKSAGARTLRPSEAEELEILASQTLVVRGSGSRQSEDEILGSRTLLLSRGSRPGATPVNEDEILAAHTMVISGGALRLQDIIPADVLAKLDAALGDDE